MSQSESGLKLLSTWKVVGGFVKKFQHHSTSTKCDMKFSIFFPPSIAESSSANNERVPAIYWLSGLTCTDDNFMHKAGAFRAAAAANVALICPDTSPRGLNLPEEKNSSVTGVTWDFGEGAGFYVNATSAPFRSNYNMYDYVTRELPSVIEAAQLGIDAVARRSIMGHSMGQEKQRGHGALISFLRNPGAYASVSAFAPICNPVSCDWGVKAFSGYFGEGEREGEWKNWDATLLVSSYSGPATSILVDQGEADDFLHKGQLRPEKMKEACDASGGKVTLNLRMQPGYDHSYYFIQTFIDEHIAFHAKALNSAK